MPPSAASTTRLHIEFDDDAIGAADALLTLLRVPKVAVTPKPGTSETPGERDDASTLDPDDD